MVLQNYCGKAIMVRLIFDYLYHPASRCWRLPAYTSKNYLSGFGHSCHFRHRLHLHNARTASEALARFKQDTYDLLLLDVTLPDGTGFDVCKEVRAISTIPIIFLTASDQEISIVRGLDIGADDYITKPFKLNELLSRIKAILRRSLQFSKAAAVLEANGIRIDTAERRVWKNGKSLDLPLVEYKLLCLFLQNPNHLLSRELILDRMWDGNGNFVDDNTLSVYIRRLRNKIEDTPNQPKFLLTERGIGYKWVVV